MKHLAIISSALLLFGCMEPVPSEGDPSNESDPFFDPLPIGGDGGGECAHPEEGCACDTDVPIDCYLPPVEERGVLMCNAGTRYCRDGFWSGCESVRSYEVVGAATSLVTGPTSCNPCDPACAVSRDVPSDRDLPGRSTDVEYDPSAGGIRLVGGMMGSSMLTDSDGDGVPDVADDCVGPGAYRNADGSCSGTTFFFHELPYGGPAEIDPLDVNVQIRTADVYFLMDTTGSMGGEISNLRSGLTSGSYISGCGGGIIGAIRCTIPDAWFGVGHHDDYPYGSYGSSGDQVYRNHQDISASVSAAQTAVNGLALHYGADGPESQSQALWAVASGGGLGSYLPARTGCGAGRWGYPCFRDGTIPIVILFTDAPFHNGPYGYNYSFGGGGGGGSAPLPSPTSVSGNNSWGSARNTGDAATTWTGWTGNTCSATNDGSINPSCGYGSYSREAVFRFTVSTRTSITLTLEGSTYDTVLSIFNSSMGELACNDDSIGLASAITVTLNPGTYYAVVAGYYTNCGTYRFSIGNPSSGSGPPTSFPVTWAQAVSALNARNVRVITVHSGGTYGRTDADALADATSSYSSSGSRYVFPISSSGSGLSAAVVNAVVDLANYNRMDISARAVDTAGTAVDERGFVDSITAVGWGPGSCTSISGGSTFVQCLPGTHVDFRIAFRNDIVMPTTVPQVFNFFIEVIGNGTFILQRIPVRIVVPPNVPLYPPEGTYFRDYDSTLYCAPNERPDWGDLNWQVVSMPAGTSIRWEIRAANTLAALPGATPVTFTTPSTMPPVDIAARLATAGIPNLIPYLQIKAVLRSNAARTETPILRSFEVQYTCVPVE
ncbi:MAG: PPC domain-containing protein [Sandaracinaceae bacterium]|nr:PPC domain-containing protein [Sandaracinaceae bacterium]